MKASGNSHARENIINHKLFYNLYIAAADKGYELEVYVPKTDHQGFDVVFSDKRKIQKVQIKTVLFDAKTSNWEIHSQLLRPSLFNCKKLGFSPNYSGVGVEGSVLLLKIEPKKDDINIEYLYTDIYILNAFAMNLIKCDKPSAKNKKALKLIKLLSTNKKVKIPKDLFIKIKHSSALLCISGLLNNYSNFLHQRLILEYGSFYWKQGGSKPSVQTINEIKDFYKLISYS
jgi:hypothetical protein